MSKADYYDTLGIAKGASEEDIKSAYRKMAMKYHPDKNPGDKTAEDKFREATEAYEILKDPQRRTQYDQFGHAAFQKGGGPNPTGYYDMSDALRAFMSDFGSDTVFSNFFNVGGFSKPRPHQGRDLQISLPLTLEEIAKGVKKTGKVKRQDKCPTCNGTGSKSGKKGSCASCNGKGRIRRTVPSFFGQLVQEGTCSACNGEGLVITDPCHVCHGKGISPTETTIEMDIPAGASEGNYLSIAGKGDMGPHGGLAGKLLVVIKEKKHPFFQRDGNDLLCEIDISFSQAALGASKEIDAIDGKINIKIPAGTQSEKILRLKDKGLPVLNSKKRGDQLVRIHVKTPEKISPEAKKLFEQLAEQEL
jgi:molecular chaperone DnaJ